MTTPSESLHEAARRLTAAPRANGFKLEALHVYTDRSGAPLYYRIRLRNDRGEKWIRPMCPSGDSFKLGEPPADQFPAGKPLYRLHELARADAGPVVVTEGELKADRLAALGLNVTTSGGADSATRADWSPLTGREVMVWPDHDEPGHRYAAAVSEILNRRNCAVRTVDTAALGLGPKGDAVDWLALHPEASSTDVLGLPCLAAPSPPAIAVVPWPEPRRLRVDLPAAPAFDADNLLPRALAEFVLDEADRMPCSPDLVAAALIVALGSVIGARVALKPKRRDDWIVTPNLYGGGVGDPSSKKTPAFSVAMRFLDRLEAKEVERCAELMRAYEAELAVYEAHRAAAQSKIKRAAGNSGASTADLMCEAKSLLEGLEPPDEPLVRRYKTNDATTEKIGDLLACNPAGLLVFRDELFGLLASWDKEGREGDRAFYLEGWNGTSSFNVDRIQRGSLHVPNLCLSVFGGIQPELLERYLASMVDDLDNDGRIQRFQVLVFPDNVPWAWRDRHPVKGAREAVRAVFDRLASLDPELVGAVPANDFVKLPHIGFDADAQEVFIEWATELHKEKIAREHNPLMRQHLAKFEKLFCALALILHLAESRMGEVQRDTALRAAAWCQYLEGHARRIYALVDAGRINAAQALGRKLEARKLTDGFTVRDVSRKGWRIFETTTRIEAALSVLEEYGWVRGIEGPEQPQGGRPTVRYAINPRIAGGAP